MQNKHSTEFLNAVSLEMGKGLSYDSAFTRVSHNRPDLLKKMHHPPLIGEARDAAAAKVRTQFANAGVSSALGKNLAGLFPKPLADALSITPDDSDDAVKTKIIQGATSLDSTQAYTLWQVIVAAIKKTSGAAIDAQSKAQALLPSLLELVGSPTAS